MYHSVAYFNLLMGYLVMLCYHILSNGRNVHEKLVRIWKEVAMMH